MRIYEAASRPALAVVAVIASGLAAGIYFLIGLEVVHVVTDVPATSDVRSFGMAAGTAFLILALLVLTVQSRVLWVAASLLQVGVLAMYLAVAPQRDPPFEMWGLLIKACQLVVLACLVSLLMRPTVKAGALHGPPDRVALSR